MAIKDNFDLPQEVLYKEGNIWINRKNNQLRYSVGEDIANQWLNPLSTYKVGTAEKLKKGQPVSIGLIEQLDEDCKGVGDNAIVASDPSKNQFSVGILLEPGEKTSLKEVHVQSHGQIVYDLANKDDDDYYLPPHSDTSFDWKYSEIGKPVYVSNKLPGELTLDLADATYNGGNIICVGRLADAPLASEKDQRIVIEIALSGDVRGVVDTTQISVKIQSSVDEGVAPTEYKIASDNDKIFAVKLIDGVGHIVINNSQLTSNAENDVAGVFVASPTDGKIDLTQYFGKDIIITRLGIVDGDFGFGRSSFGKTAFLDEGEVVFASTNDSVEYKVGVGFGDKKFLVDCRYAKSIQKSEMIGAIKPVYGEDLVDPGFVLVDPSVVHTVYDESIDWEPLIRQCYAKDIFVFSATKNGEFKVYNECGMPIEDTSLNSGDGILSKKNKKYFKFRELYYTINDYDSSGHVSGTKKCACQIKYSREGSPESQAYVWPEQCYQLDIPYKAEGTEGGSLNSSNLQINITNLVQLGAYMDNNGQNIESYDIVVQEKNSKQTISPGFSVNKDGKYFGYEWQITSSAGYTFLNMITQPEDVLNKNCLGITWPIGQKYAGTIQLLVTVRRRPTQYNSLYLNQYPVSNPWTPLVDSANNLVIAGNKIYLGGSVEANDTDGDATSGFTRPVLSSIELCAPDGENTAGITYRILDSENKTDKFVEKFVIGEGNRTKEIIWTFDLTDPTKPVAELNAQFAASFMAESTADEEGTPYSGKALGLFNAIGPDVFDRKSDDKKSVSITKKSIDNQLLNNTFTKNYIDNIELFRNSKIVNSYNLKDETSLNEIVSLGWNANHDRLDYQSYLGLLAKAASEAEEKLLKIERILYGTMPDDYYKDSGEYTGIFKYFVDDLGILRFFDFLENIGFIQNRKYSLNAHGKELFDSIFSESMDIPTVEDYSSWLLYYIIDNYGGYKSTKSNDSNSYQNEIKKFNNKFNSSTDAFGSIVDYIKSQNLKVSHTAELWSYYVNQSFLDQIPLIQMSAPKSFPDGWFKGSSKNFFQTVDSFTFKKFTKGYNTDEENNTFGKGSIGYNGSPYQWPLTADKNWESKAGFTLEENFFGNNIIGVSDAIGSSLIKDGFSYYVDYYVGKDESSLNGTEASFSPQSVEGVIYDIIIKLSYIRNQFNIDGTFDSKKTFVSSFSVLSYKSAVPTIAPISKKRIFNDVTEKENCYSAFTFSNDKVLDGGSLILEKDAEKINVTNFDTSEDSSAIGYNDMARRWGGKSYVFKTKNGIAFTRVTHLFALYLIAEIAGLESSIRNAVLKGVDDGLDENNNPKTRELTDEELNIYCYAYNGLIESMATRKVYTDHSYKRHETCSGTPFGLEISEEIAEQLKITKDDFRNGKNLKLTSYGLNTQTAEMSYLSAVSQNYIEGNDEDYATAFAKKISFGFEPGNSLAISIFTEIADGLPSANYYEALYPSWIDYIGNGCKTFVTYLDDKEIGNDKGIWERYTFDYTEVDQLVTEYVSSDKTYLDKYKIFFGFLDSATCQGSTEERSYPWYQQPIANNGLTWTSKDKKVHSADFNDFIEKTFYSFDYLFNPIVDQNVMAPKEEKDIFGKTTGYKWTIGDSNEDRQKHDDVIGSDETLKKLDEFFKDTSNGYTLSSTTKTQIGEKLQPTRVDSSIVGVEEKEIKFNKDRAYEKGYFFDNDTFGETSFNGSSVKFDSSKWKKEKVIATVDGAPTSSDSVDISQSEILASEWKETTLPHRLYSVEDNSSTKEQTFVQSIKDNKTDGVDGGKLSGSFSNGDISATYDDTEYSLSGDTEFVKSVSYVEPSVSLQESVVTGIKTAKKAVISASKAAAGDYTMVVGPAAGKSFAEAGDYNVDMSGVTVDLETGKLSGVAKVTVAPMTPETSTLSISDAETEDFIAELDTGAQSFASGSFTSSNGAVGIIGAGVTKNAKFDKKDILVKVDDHVHTITPTEKVVHVYGKPSHYYKNYYTKPLNRKQIKLINQYEFKPIYKTTDRLSNDRIDYTGEMYHNETTTVKPQIYGKTSEIRSFAFKDDSFINGRILPVPDIKMSMYANSIMRLFKLSLKKGPSDYGEVLDNSSDNSSLTGKFLSKIIISDTENRSLYIRYRGVEKKVSSIQLITFGISNPENEILKESVHIDTSIQVIINNSGVNGKYECFRKKQNYFIVMEFEILETVTSYVFNPANNRTIQYKDSELALDEANFTEGEDHKALDFDVWSEFFVQNCTSMCIIGNKVFVPGGSLEPNTDACSKTKDAIDSLKSMSSMYEQGRVEFVVKKEDYNV